jgi:hypothetical protein
MATASPMHRQAVAVPTGVLAAGLHRSFTVKKAPCWPPKHSKPTIGLQWTYLI